MPSPIIIHLFSTFTSSLLPFIPVSFLSVELPEKVICHDLLLCLSIICISLPVGMAALEGNSRSELDSSISRGQQRCARPFLTLWILPSPAGHLYSLPANIFCVMLLPVHRIQRPHSGTNKIQEISYTCQCSVLAFADISGPFLFGARPRTSAEFSLSRTRINFISCPVELHLM